MQENCIICNSESKYKCPTCQLHYCSVDCFKQHKVQKCNPVIKENVDSIIKKCDEINYPTSDTVSKEKLKLLSTNKEVNDLLTNPHLCNLLKTIDECDNPDVIMQKAMLEPIFVEFADACLKVVEPPPDDKK